MYFLILLALLAVGGGLIALGVARGRNGPTMLGVLWMAATIGCFSLLDLWGEALWFHALGYGDRFWTVITTQASCLVVGAALGGAGVWLVTIPLGRARPGFGWWPALAGAAGGAVAGLEGWSTVLVFLNRVPAGLTEPVWGLDTGFYLFTLPFLEWLQGLLTWIAVVAVLSTAVAAVIPDDNARRNAPGGGIAIGPGFELPILAASFSLVLAVAAGNLLEVFRLLFSQSGIVAGPGWTDVHVRLPAFLFLSVWVAALGIALFFAGPRALAARWGARFIRLRSRALQAVGLQWVVVLGSWILVAGILPWLSQKLLVEPNEITLEEPYIARNIRFTRYGFDLQEIEEKQFSLRESISRAVIDRNQHLVSELRLWDWRALDAVYQQFQEIRLYYEFADVDIDRYTLEGRYREVMVSAREMAPANLPAASQTFVNHRFKYTHGYGLTMATVSDFTASGLPNLLVRDIPPVSSYPELEVTRPEIYYGELTREPVVVNTSQPEFDYPSGEDNVYTHYQGKGGVPLDGLWRKFLYGWKFDGTAFLLSSYPDRDSRVMFHRRVRQRAAYLAPFLEFDRDPYIVIADGRLYWILDAYTRSDRFPYSAAFDLAQYAQSPAGGDTEDVAQFHGANYMRNAVKVVIDAYEGSVDFYVFDRQDPVIRVWRKAFPGMFHDRESLPESLRRHVRYPQGLLLTQGLVYTKYHMRSPAVFYNQEDLWVRATEKHYDRTRPVEPYYILWELPGSDEAEFVLMLPFTPKDRQVLVGWIAGLSDGDNYGRFLAYKFPKERRVLGPQQVETKIDQDRFLSGQLTLWDQRGSNVIRGNVLAIPLEGTLLYVEPIYLQAETAAYPELRVVVVMQGDNMSYGDSLEEALSGLLGDNKPPALPTAAGEVMSAAQLGREADRAFREYLSAQGEGRFDDAAQALTRLQQLLEKLGGHE